MFRALWKALARPSLCGAALLSLTNLLGAQEVRIPTLQPPTAVLPAMLPSTPAFEPILPVQAKEPVAAPRTIAPPMQVDDVKTRIERLEKQNQELLDALRGLKQQPQGLPTTAPIAPSQGGNLSPNDVKNIVGDYIAAKAAKDKAKADEDKAAEQARGFTVGKSTAINGSWTNNQPWFETADKSFRIHIGGRIQPEWVFGAQADGNVAAGVGGTGQFLEGFNMRRARLEADGWLWEVIDFFIEYDFANQFSTGAPQTFTGPGTINQAPNSDGNTIGVPAPTDVWASINHLPFLGTVRIGSLKPIIGLEHLISSRYLDFMERNSAFDAYYNRNNGFAPGFLFGNETADGRLTWGLSITKPNNTLFGWTTGGGEWQYTGRITAVPYYEANGRCMVHLGLGAAYISNLDNGQANFNTRWLLRNGGPNLQNTVVRSILNAESQAMINPELFVNMGPLSIQAEYTGTWVNGVTSFAVPQTGLGTFIATAPKQYYSQSAYIQAMYFLTGEHRPYGKTYVHSSGPAPTRVVPHRNFFWVPGQGGNGNPFSLGAWQVGARYCYTNLDNNGINGGINHEVTFGLNWFLNPNMKLQWNYDVGRRELQAPGTSNGNYSGFGMRMTFDF